MSNFERTSPSGRLVVPLYQLVQKGHESIKHQVEFWPLYGPVCPALWTTNGSIGYVAKLTASAVSLGVYEVQEAHIEADFTDAQSISSALKKAWDSSQGGK